MMNALHTAPKRFLLLYAIALLAVLSGYASAQAEAPIRLNALSRDGGHPVIAVADDGRAMAVWDAYDGAGRRRVWFAESDVLGQWAPETALSGPLAPSASDPDLALDADGAPHVVWTQANGEMSHILYSRRPAGGAPAWTAPRRLDITDEMTCELPSIRIDAAGRRHAIWQAGRGTLYRIYGATAPAPDAASTASAASWRVDLIGDPSDGYAAFSPRLIRSEPLMAFWYACDSRGFHPRAAHAPAAPGEDWRPIPRLEGFESVPSERLPMLAPDRRGGLVAMWTDAVGGGPERVWMARGAPGALAVWPADDRPDAVNRDPVIDVGPDGQVGLCWVAETAGEKRIMARIFEAGADGQGLDRPSVPVSDPTDPYVDSPSVVYGPDGRLNVAWRSRREAGGTGDVWLASVR